MLVVNQVQVMLLQIITCHAIVYLPLWPCPLGKILEGLALYQ